MKSLSWLSGLALLCAASAVTAASNDLGICIIGCDQALASCQQLLGEKGHCPRKYQGCKQDCTAPPKALVGTKAEQKRTICEQRCDLNGSVCEESNRGNTASCAAGRESCIVRCQ